MSLDVALYRAGGGRVFTPAPALPPTFSHNRRGPAACSVFFPCSLEEAFRIRNTSGLLEIVIRDGGETVWRGRVEDRAIRNNGIALVAFGYARAFSDVVYTGLWSDTGSAGWREVTLTDAPAVTGMQPQMFNFDNNNRLYMATKKGATYAVNDRCEMSYAAPHNGERDIVYFTSSYSMLLPAGWELRLVRMDDDFTNRTTITTVVATGSLQSGTLSGAFAANGQARIGVSIVNATGGDSSPAGEDGDNYATITAMRTTTMVPVATPISASVIAASLADYVDGINAGQMMGQMVATTSTDLRDELYEDEAPADILDYLALREGYEWGVDANKVFYFRPRNTAGRVFYVDATALELEESLDEVYNSVYAVYRDANGRLKRTATAEDARNQQIYGLMRQSVIKAQTTSATEAGNWRDARLDDLAAYSMRANVQFGAMYDRAGNERPLHDLRAGDTVFIRNLPPTLAADIDTLREVVVARVEYDAATGAIAIEPDTPVPTLVTLIAQRGM